MKLHAVDIAIIVCYFAVVILVGLWVSRRGAKNLESYFLGGKSLRWYVLGVSDASGMFDISGTMVLVTWLFMYGLKSIWLPWVWPTFNQVFLMMFLSAWLRRSNVLTGAEWIKTRFGSDRGANLAHISVVTFALVAVVGMLAYAFKGIGKFAVEMFPWRFTNTTEGIFSDANIYAIILMGLTSLYTVKGGMISVVITEVMQFSILTVTSIVIGIIAISTVRPSEIQHLIPEGWMSPFFGQTVGLDWTGIFEKVNQAIQSEGNEWFAIIFGLMLCKGVLASLAGPMPNYDMQRILATRNPREACLMNGWVTTVLMFPRYMMVAGLTLMALKFCTPELKAMDKPDLERLLPLVLFNYMPAGVVGFLLAGLLAAFMSNFAATVNAAPAYIVNDIYKRYINPNAPAKTEIRMSRISSLAILFLGLLLGLITKNIFDIMWWIVGALNGAYVIANVLKWTWWRFNGYGYFWGMMIGILAAMFVPGGMQHFQDQRSKLLSTADLANVPQLAASINAATNGVSQYLQGQLTPATRDLLARNLGDPDQALAPALVTDLNRILAGGSLFDTNRFAGVSLSSRTTSLAKKKEPQPADLLLLNRMLLEDAYPVSIVSRFRFGLNALYTFPIIFVLSLVGCLLGTALGKAEDEAVLKKFYKNVNPWGFWGPIRAKVLQEDPAFKPNHNFRRDMINVLVGMIWQLCLVALPIFIVFRNWPWAGGIAVLLVVTSVFIKFNWYDKLEKAA